MDVPKDDDQAGIDGGDLESDSSGSGSEADDEGEGDAAGACTCSICEITAIMLYSIHHPHVPQR